VVGSYLQNTVAVTKYLRWITYREERMILALGYRSFGPWSVGLFSGLWQSRVWWLGVHGRAKLLTTCWPGSKEREEGARVPTFFLWHSSNDLTSSH
jgi:hypothetical protein